MTLEKSQRFEIELQIIVDFISQDSPKRALAFYDELISKIEQIPHNPYIHRKRESLNDESIRELIFKGYTIPYFISSEEEKIIILGIFNQNIWE